MQSRPSLPLAAILLSCLSVTAQADYQFHQRVKGLVKAPTVTTCAALPTEYAGLCAGDTGSALHAKIHGLTYALDPVSPDEAYQCSTGRYANDYEAVDLAPLVSKPVYTPYQSYQAPYYSWSTHDIRGNIMQVNPDLSRSSNFHYLTHYFWSVASGSVGVAQPGTRESLVGNKSVSYSNRNMYMRSDLNTEAVAYRACRLP